VGSCWDRYMVRIREVKESCKIIRQAVAKLTPGDVRESVPSALNLRQAKSICARSVLAENWVITSSATAA